jgi:hypothetical protein
LKESVTYNSEISAGNCFFTVRPIPPSGFVLAGSLGFGSGLSGIQKAFFLKQAIVRSYEAIRMQRRFIPVLNRQCFRLGLEEQPLISI